MKQNQHIARLPMKIRAVILGKYVKINVIANVIIIVLLCFWLPI